MKKYISDFRSPHWFGQFYLRLFPLADMIAAECAPKLHFWTVEAHAKRRGIVFEKDIKKAACTPQEAEWHGLLSTFGWQGSPTRLTAVCKLLTSNDFMTWPQLEDAADPREWPGSEGFEEQELHAIRRLTRTGKERPRSPVHAKTVSVAEKLGGGEVSCITVKEPASTIADGVGPIAALRRARLQDMSRANREDWLEGARLDAILGGCRRSLPSVRSGLRCYIAFVGAPCPELSFTRHFSLGQHMFVF